MSVQSNLTDKNVIYGEIQSHSKETGYWNSNIVDIPNRMNFCGQHYEGETGVTLKEGLNEYLGPCNGDNVSSINEFYNMNSNNNVTPTYVPHTSNSTVKVLSDISNNCILKNNLYKSSFNCSGKFWNQCPIKLQEKQNSVLVNISDTSSESDSRELIPSLTKTTYDCEKISHFSVMCQNKTSEKPINVHILKRNWNISDCMRNNFSTRRDTNILGNFCNGRNVIEQEATLYRNNKYVSPLACSSGSQSWKPYPQLQTSQMNYNRLSGGIPSLAAVQKPNVFKVTAHQEKINQEPSENTKVIYNHSFLVNPGSASSSTLLPNVECYPLDSEDLHRRDGSGIKETKDNVENHATTSEMTQSYSLPVLPHNKAMLKTFSMFSVVQKKLKWSCSCCGESLATRLSLTTHIKSHLLPWCRECLKVVNSNEQLQSHMEKKHPSSDTETDQPETQFVTSKYGRRRRVYSPATLLPKRRFDVKK